MSSNLDWLIKKIDDLKPQERAQLDQHLVSKIASDAENLSQQYEMELASEYIEEAKEIRKNWGKMRGLSSGLRSIDKLTLGLVKDEVIVVGGATSNGKTALCVNIAANVVAQGRSVLFVTLEMSKAQVTGRMLYTDDGFEENSALLVYQKADEFNWQSVDGLIMKAVKEMGVELVIVDHLHYFTRELQNTAEDLGRITKEFSKNAKRHRVPIMLISHTRKGEGNNIDDLRGSSYIAQDADIVLMVSRDKELPDYITVSCQKNRDRGVNFEDNTVILNFHKTRISEIGGDVPWNTFQQ